MALTCSFNTRAGSGTIEIRENGNLPTSDKLEVTDVSKLEIDFDLKEESKEANNVFFSPSEFTVNFFDTVGQYSLFNLIDGILSTTDISLKLDFTTDGGNSVTMPFIFTKNDATYQREKRSVEIEAVLDLDSDITVSEVVNYDTGDHVATDRSVGNSITAYDFIENYFEMYASGQSVNLTYGFSDANPFNDGQYSWVVNDRSEGGTNNEPDPKASSILFRIGAMDGSFVGSLMGYNFIINRLDTSNSIQINESEVESLELDFGLENYYRLEASFSDHFDYNEDGYFDDNVQSWFSAIEDGTTLNEDGTKRLRIHFANRGVLKLMQWDTTNSQFDYLQGNVDRQYIKDIREGENILRMRNGTGSLSVGDQFFFSEPQADTTQHVTYDDRVYEITEILNSELVVIDPPAHRDFEKRTEDSVTEFCGINIESPQELYTPSILANALDSYGKAYGAQGSRQVSFVLWDLDRMNPQDAIELDGSFPDPIANKIVRPSKLVYNLLNDKIEVEAYEL